MTGKVRNEIRKIRATLRRRGFIDYLYFTEYEGKDPDLDADPDQYERTVVTTGTTPRRRSAPAR